ncbi:High-affinity Na(+)/H(+) antiporter NhaS3 [Cytospora mali]|uniref:High-affinity Na(+)/H(+) antiporter NhaS3 n=1 Tax=Cytospora mali TaxID=578113 RepID=A0A194VID3_CYTMA|nr:High-affinity Na(+)/H(+) antiporter NhaS3 [Valsa mali]
MPATGFLQYQEPDILSLLVLISFFFFLSSLGWVFNKIIGAGLIGQILVGVLYGTPVGNILDTEWQDTFMVLGYIGLILIIFEGGLTIRLDLLKANFLLSVLAATIGITTPIALCYLILFLGFGYGALETFIVGAALSTTSLGTTFIVISNSASVDLTHTKVGTVLVSAALFDDVVGLIMVSVISNLGGFNDGGGTNIGWVVGRPIVASFAIGAISPLLAKYVAGPLYRRLLEKRVASLGQKASICIMTLIMSAHIVTCAYAGASLLFGAFLAGAFLIALPSQPTDPVQLEGGEMQEAPGFHAAFETYVSGAQAFILEPLFFASIGFAIPFKRLWTGTIIWRGIVFSLLMAVGKAVVGLSVPLWDFFSRTPPSEEKPAPGARASSNAWAAATLLGMAMIARGEIGLLIIQLGLNTTSALSEEAFLVAIWAIVLNTILGPVSVALLLKRSEKTIAGDSRWGIQEKGSGDSGASGALRRCQSRLASGITKT